MIRHFVLSLFITTLTLIPVSPVQANQNSSNKPLGHGYEFEGNGKRKLPCFGGTYRKENPPEQTIKLKNPADFKRALINQMPILQRKPYKRWNSGPLSLSNQELYSMSSMLSNLPSQLNTSTLLNSFDSFLIRGEDGCGNTHFTAYFSPILKVKARPDNEYRYPLYRKPYRWPGGRKLTRYQIDQQGRLAGRGLELAYSNSLLANYFLQVQGSGLVEYLDTGEKVTMQFGGQNGYSYTSLGRFLVNNNFISADKISLNSIREFFDQHPDKLIPFVSKNRSYTFFKKSTSGPRGALSTEVVPLISIAVDRKYIPLGSVLLAEIPQLDEAGKVKSHKLTLLVAQDVGGAIRGTGHVDLYMGAGSKAQEMASNMHHYGRLWLLTPKGY